METEGKPWNTEDMRPFWADPMGKLIKEDACGCRHYELGNGICGKHFTELLDKLLEEYPEAVSEIHDNS